MGWGLGCLRQLGDQAVRSRTPSGGVGPGWLGLRFCPDYPIILEELPFHGIDEEGGP